MTLPTTRTAATGETDHGEVERLDLAIQDFHIQRLPPGRRRTGHLAIASRAVGTGRQLPYLAVTGNSPGPTLVVFAGVHGDEYEGMEAIPLVFAQTTPQELCGRLVMLPVCNPAAFEAGERCGPVDGLNLARVYPGDPGGTLTQRIAYWTGQRLISQADFLIDLHSGSSDADAPTLAGYIHDAGPLGQASLAGARAFGAPVLWGHPLPLPPGRTISLATLLGVPSLYTETPGGGRAPKGMAARYAQGVHNVMHHLGMLPGAPQPARTTHHLFGDGDLDQVMLAPESGLFIACVDLLDQVTAGQKLGEIRDSFGATLATIKADRAGVVILLRRKRRVHVGEGLVQITGVAQPSHPAI